MRLTRCSWPKFLSSPGSPCLGPESPRQLQPETDGPLLKPCGGPGALCREHRTAPGRRVWSARRVSGGSGGSSPRASTVQSMFAVTAARIDADDPLAGLELGEHAEPAPADGWTTVTVKATALNHHDVWTLRGVGISPDRLPIVLGCDAAGLDADGNEVVVHAVISENPAGDE